MSSNGRLAIKMFYSYQSPKSTEYTAIAKESNRAQNPSVSTLVFFGSHPPLAYESNPDLSSDESDQSNSFNTRQLPGEKSPQI